MCLDFSSGSWLPRNVCGWHLPRLHRVVATNCRLRVACKAESFFCALFLKIPSLGTDCILFVPAPFVYSDEICFHICREVCPVRMDQVYLSCLSNCGGLWLLCMQMCKEIKGSLGEQLLCTLSHWDFNGPGLVWVLESLLVQQGQGKS